MCADVLDPRIGFALAAYGLVEGSKTMPIPPARPDSAKKPWFNRS